jgi:hypothetical protein
MPWYSVNTFKINAQGIVVGLPIISEFIKLASLINAAQIEQQLQLNLGFLRYLIYIF